VPGIVGIKDATGNIERGSDLLKRVPAGFQRVQRRRRYGDRPDAAGWQGFHFGDGQRGTGT
jgi:dihydrodipicolinate synthase/N-acetylneuraminate lyase